MNVDQVLARANTAGRTTRLYRLWVKGSATMVARYFEPAADEERRQVLVQLANTGSIPSVWSAEWRLDEAL